MFDYKLQDEIPEWCAQARTLLHNSTITIVGVGALGTQVANMIIRLGAEKMVLIDDDIITTKNLSRQTLFSEKDCGLPKVVVAKKKLLNIRKIKIAGQEEKLTTSSVERLLTGTNLIFCCTDNLNSRKTVGTWCAKNNVSWVHAAAYQTYGEVMDGRYYLNFIKGKKSSARCDRQGILIQTAAMTASLQVSIGLQILLGTAPKTLLRIDAWQGRIDHISFS